MSTFRTVRRRVLLLLVLLALGSRVTRCSAYYWSIFSDPHCTQLVPAYSYADFFDASDESVCLQGDELSQPILLNCGGWTLSGDRVLPPSQTVEATYYSGNATHFGYTSCSDVGRCGTVWL